MILALILVQERFMTWEIFVRLGPAELGPSADTRMWLKIGRS